MPIRLKPIARHALSILVFFEHSLVVAMPSDMTKDQRTRANLRGECYLKKKRRNDGKFKEDLPNDLVLEKWLKFLDLQAKLPNPGETAALAEMRKMCPGQLATLQEIEEIHREMHFRTPYWKGKAADTDIPERVLTPAEVDVINCKYLELNAAFLEKRHGQNTGEAIAEAERNLTAQNLKAQELIVEVRREMNERINEIKVW